MGCPVGPKGPEHWFKIRINGVWTCLCGERRDKHGAPRANLKVIE